MIIISSSAYVTQDIQGELGKIPPVFLPLANKKLIFRQITALQSAFPEETIILSLPKSYHLADNLRESIAKLNVKIVQVPDHLSLSQSVLFVINTNFDGIDKASIKILYGDTLVNDYDFCKNIADVIGVSYTEKDYHWEYADTNHLNRIWCGFFKFSNIAVLLESLTLYSSNFVTAIKNYMAKTQTQFIDVKTWYDLGHLNSYFETRTKLTTQRSFNGLEIDNNVLTKYSQQTDKMRAEAQWFERIPAHLKINTPMLISHNAKENQYFYQLEYISSLPLNELFIHGNIITLEWNTIFKKIKQFMDDCQLVDLSPQQIESIDEDFAAMLADKTYQRLYQYFDQMNISHQAIDETQHYHGHELPSLSKIINQCVDWVNQSDARPSILHGDLCFSNIIFDSRRELIKVFDPRGMNVKGELTIYGDQRYDLAKLAHSTLGLYDFIIAGEYHIKDKDTHQAQLVFNSVNHLSEIQNIFKNIFLDTDELARAIHSLVVLLFLSMLPLHSDNEARQKAMLLNAKRIYLELII